MPYVQSPCGCRPEFTFTPNPTALTGDPICPRVAQCIQSNPAMVCDVIQTNTTLTKTGCELSITPGGNGQVLTTVGGQVVWVTPPTDDSIDCSVTNTIVGNLIATHTNEAGTVVNINESITTFADTVSGHLIANYTNESGTVIPINETISTIVDNGDGTYTFTNEAGTVVNIDVQAPDATTVLDTQTVNLTLTGSQISASVIPGCGLKNTTGGVAVANSGTWGSGLLNLPGAATSGSPIYCDTNGQIRTLPPKVTGFNTDAGCPAQTFDVASNIGNTVIFNTAVQTATVTNSSTAYNANMFRSIAASVKYEFGPGTDVEFQVWHSINGGAYFLAERTELVTSAALESRWDAPDRYRLDYVLAPGETYTVSVQVRVKINAGSGLVENPCVYISLNYESQ